MGLILWIDQNTFATSLIERVYKKKNAPFYCLSSVEDFSYLVDDLNPAVIVLDGETFLKNPEGFKAQYEASPKMQATPFIFLEARGDMSFIGHKIGDLTRPLDPFELPKHLNKMMGTT